MDFDENLLLEFEKKINTINPENSDIKINILGYGEISLVFEILEDKNHGLAYKRLPIFNSEQQVERHIKAYEEYRKMLVEQAGLNIPEQDTFYTNSINKHGSIIPGKLTLFCIQKKIDPQKFGNKLIHKLDFEQIETLIYLILRELKKVWQFNANHEDIEIGIDGQISNWAILEENADNNHSYKITKNTRLSYLDTSTPLYRKNQIEAIEPVLLLKSAPVSIRWLLKLLFLDEVVDRYYDRRFVIIDLLANFYKEQKSEILPDLLKLANNYLKTDAFEFKFEPITLFELEKYYKNDKRIWQIFQSMRRLDRWFTTKVRRKRYDFYLPDKIKR